MLALLFLAKLIFWLIAGAYGLYGLLFGLALAFQLPGPRGGL